jgi:alpha-tubulin suppressor-like RCC1 family protein
VAVAAGTVYSLALKSDGSLAAWGNDIYGQTNVPSGTDFMAIEAGENHSVALRLDGSLVAWGANGNGQTIVPAGNGYTAIAAANTHSLAIQHQVPEPATLALLTIGVPFLVLRKSRP